MMRDAYRAMLDKASPKEVALQALKLVRARLSYLKETQGRGVFAADDVQDAESVLDEAIERQP